MAVNAPRPILRIMLWTSVWLLASFGVKSVNSAIFAADIPDAEAKSSAGSRPLPHWIWADGPDHQSSSLKTVTTAPFKSNANTFVFSHRSVVDTGVREAHLRFAADFCRGKIHLNGEVLATVDPYSPTLTLDVTNWIKAGDNEIAVTATPVAGPSAIAFELTLIGKGGQSTWIRSDPSWMVLELPQGNEMGKLPGNARKVLDQGTVLPELWAVGTRPISISPVENYEQWQQAKGAEAATRGPKFWVAPGFEVQLVHSALADQGSWVSMAFDSAGRLIVAREDKGFLRFTLDSERAAVARTEVIASDLLECRGLIYVNDSLYINANNSKAMYRMRDTDGDGQFETLQKLRDFPGNVGHGRNDLAIGPEGDIYSIHGDSVQAPASPILELTSPLRDSRRGPVMQEGQLVRTNSDGTNWTLICTGLRNPFGIAFNPAGDLFTYDADNEYDVGAPWYRATRIVQLVSGADYGYRVSQGRWPPYFPDRPDTGLPTLEVGRGSPTSMVFGTHGKFPSVYRNCLFALDWTYGRVLAIHMAPRGAGYRAESELFLQGKPLNVTDIAIGPDGAMYLITGGRKTQSCLYRITYTRDIPAPGPATAHERAADRFAQTQRVTRQQLEAFHGRIDPSAIEVAWPYLGDADPVVRHAARIAIEQQPADSWRDRAVSQAVGPQALSAWMSLVRIGNADSIRKMIPTMLAMDPSADGPRGTMTLLHVYQQISSEYPQVFAAYRTEIVNQLLRAWPTMVPDGLWISPYGSSEELRRRIAVTIGEWGIVEAIQPTVTTLLSSPVQEDQLAALLALRHHKLGWSIDQRRRYFESLNGANAFVAGEGMPTFLSRLRADAVASLSLSERTSLGTLLEASAEATNGTEPSSPRTGVVKKWGLSDLMPLFENDSTAGDAKRGALIFREAQCVRCHRVGARGPAVGPDLTFVARRFSRRDICESIIDPSLTVAENYRNSQIVTTSGRVIVGRILTDGDYRTQKLKINSNPLQPAQIEEIDKKEVEEFQLIESSPMPRGLLDGFTLDEIRDLLTYLDGGVK